MVTNGWSWKLLVPRGFLGFSKKVEKDITPLLFQPSYVLVQVGGDKLALVY